MDKILFLLLINYVFLSIKIENFYQLLNDFSYDFIFRDNNNIKEKFNNIFLNNNIFIINNNYIIILLSFGTKIYKEFIYIVFSYLI